MPSELENSQVIELLLNMLMISGKLNPSKFLDLHKTELKEINLLVKNKDYKLLKFKKKIKLKFDKLYFELQYNKKKKYYFI